MVHEALTLERLNAIEPRQAAALLIARREEGLTQGEQQLLEAWLRTKPGHRDLLASAEQAWQVFSGTESHEILTAMRAHALAAAPQRRSRWPLLAFAASLLVAIGMGWIVLESRARPDATFQYASANGQVQDIALPDGSEMILDAESSVVGTFGEGARIVELRRGRAVFLVAPDPSRPFSVSAGDYRVVATGTRFEINLLPEGLTVTLIEGRVSVQPADASRAPIELEPGQVFRERGREQEIRTVEGVGESIIAWRNGLLQFDDHRLIEAAAVINRYSKDQIVIRNAAVARLNVSGQFPAGDAQRFADTVAEMHNLRAVRLASQIEISAAE